MARVPRALPSPARRNSRAAADVERKVGGYSLKELADMMHDYVPGAIATLGQKAAEGDTPSAKTVLEFLTAVAKDSNTESSNEVLDQIARIRAGS